MDVGELRSRGPMGFRSTSVKVEMEWEDTSTYAPPLVYAFAANRGSILDALKRILGKAENENR